MNDRPKRRVRPVFSLRMFLVVVVLLGGWIGWNASLIGERWRLAAWAGEKGASAVHVDEQQSQSAKDFPPRRLPIVWRLIGIQAVSFIYLPSDQFTFADGRRLQAAFPEAEVFFQTGDSYTLLLRRESEIVIN